MPVLSNHHLLLATLLVANALATESLPIFLHQICPAAVAIAISTGFLVLFGEILPQAFCTGPNQLKIAEFCVPIVIILKLIFWPICYPTAKFLDWLLGVHGAQRYKKQDLATLIELHQQQEVEEDGEVSSHRFTQFH